MWDLLKLFDHLAPVLISLFIIVAVIFFVKGRPYLKYIALVSEADNPEGVEKLAKHLAHKAGGRHINVDDQWVSFVPAAEAIYLSFLKSLNQ